MGSHLACCSGVPWLSSVGMNLRPTERQAEGVTSRRRLPGACHTTMALTLEPGGGPTTAGWLVGRCPCAGRAQRDAHADVQLQAAGEVGQRSHGDAVLQRQAALAHLLPAGGRAWGGVGWGSDGIWSRDKATDWALEAPWRVTMSP